MTLLKVFTIIFLIFIILIIIYGRKKSIKATLIVVFSSSGLLIIAWRANLKEESIKMKVTSNSAFSIGTVIKYSPKKQKTFGYYTTGWVRMTTRMNGQRYETESSILMPTDYTWGGPEGKSFLVVYDSLDVQTCILLFDYPIEESDDYMRYLEEFKNQPLDIGQTRDTCLIKLLKFLY